MSHTDTIILLTKAFEFAAIKHRHQTRKSDNSSYIIHPAGVASLLTDAGITDSDIIIAALLHDTIEDTDTTLEEISELFNVRIAGIVVQVSDNRSLSQIERKKAQIVHAKTIQYEAKLVKLADKLHNLTALTTSRPVGWTDDIVSGYFVWASFCVDAMRGTNSYLENALDNLFVMMIPANTDREVALHSYYETLARKK